MIRIAALCRALLAVPLLLLPAWAGAWYVGVGVGPTNTEYEPTFAPATSTIDDSDTAYKVFVGNLINPNLAVELGYTDLGTVVRHTVSGLVLNLDSKTLALSVLGRLQRQPGWVMYGRLGYGMSNSDLDFGAFTGSKTTWAPVIGLGIEYTIQDRLRCGLEWEQYQNVGQNAAAGTIQVTGQNVDLFALRCSYQFSLARG
jgi:opacity protein-like surface antigen